MSERTVINCDVCGTEIRRDDDRALVVTGPTCRISFESMQYASLEVRQHLCGEACAHRILSRLLPNLL